MCAILIPALVGVGALALLGGGIGGGGNSCNTAPQQACAQSANGITIPQLAGQGTNVMSAQQQYSYNPQPMGPQSYGPPPAQYNQYSMAPAQYPAPYQGDPGMVGASVNMGGQSMVGAGGYANPGGVGIGANVGGIDASMGLGSQGY